MADRPDTTRIDRDFAPHFGKLKAIEHDARLWPEDADAPTHCAISLAEAALQRLLTDGLLPSSVVATSEGGVAICFYDGDKYADIECFNDGDVLCATVKGQDKPVVWEVGDPVATDFTCAVARIRAALS